MSLAAVSCSTSGIRAQGLTMMLPKHYIHEYKHKWNPPRLWYKSIISKGLMMGGKKHTSTPRRQGHSCTICSINASVFSEWVMETGGQSNVGPQSPEQQTLFTCGSARSCADTPDPPARLSTPWLCWLRPGRPSCVHLARWYVWLRPALSLKRMSRWVTTWRCFVFYLLITTIKTTSTTKHKLWGNQAVNVECYKREKRKLHFHFSHLEKYLYGFNHKKMTMADLNSTFMTSNSIGMK